MALIVKYHFINGLYNGFFYHCFLLSESDVELMSETISQDFVQVDGIALAPIQALSNILNGACTTEEAFYDLFVD